MIKSAILIGAVVLGLAAGAVQAETTAVGQKITAQIVMAKGKVLLNHGTGFVAAVAQTPLTVGDQLMVGNESSAELFYAASGCALTVSAGTLLRITADAPCKKGESIAMAGQTTITPAYFEVSNDANHLLALAPIVVVSGLVLVVALNYNEPDPASVP
jgi:hypothetical protein